ncbi:hypothetical protein ACFL2O_11235, partial [Thermodesulfobacteriota bacterium]
LYLLDLPMLRDLDDNSGFYWTAHGWREAWRGAGLFRSIDGGASWAMVDTIIEGATIGTATGILGEGPSTLWDEGNTLNIEVLNGELESKTEGEVLAGENAAAFGRQGRWEIIQFCNAVLESDGTYTLSKLLRGRRGTNHAVDSHEEGDAFILLTMGTIERVETDLDAIGNQFLYKAVSFGNELYDAGYMAFVNSGVGLKPYSPVHIKGRRDGSGNLTIEWIRRTRRGGDWNDLSDVPLAEAAEAYEIDIMDGSTVVRTIEASSETADYTAADQVTDFGSVQSAVTLKVYQLSDDIGRGYPGEATI